MSPNFFACLRTSPVRSKVAQLFQPPLWAFRKCSWSEYEVVSPFAELVIEAESPVLLHGIVADIETHADSILATLRSAGIAYSAEGYGPAGDLLHAWSWGVVGHDPARATTAENDHS